MSPLIKISPAA